MGVAGGTLLNGWRGALFKGWMFTSPVTAGTGLPLTPLYLAPDTGHWRHRCAAAKLHRRIGICRSAGIVAESRGLCRTACPVNGAMPGAIPSRALRSSL